MPWMLQHVYKWEFLFGFSEQAYNVELMRFDITHAVTMVMYEYEEDAGVNNNNNKIDENTPTLNQFTFERWNYLPSRSICCVNASLTDTSSGCLIPFILNYNQKIVETM